MHPQNNVEVNSGLEGYFASPRRKDSVAVVLVFMGEPR